VQLVRRVKKLVCMATSVAPMPTNERPLRQAADVQTAGTASQAMAHATVWLYAIAMQVDRIEGNGHEVFNDAARQVDLHFFIHALRQLLRSVNLVKIRAPSECQGKIEAALALFDESVPRARVARNWLEHFDEYESGTGSAQPRSGRSDPSVTWFERSPGHYSVTVAITGLEPVTIEIHRARAAAQALLAGVDRALG
jgi:hypothetical protein